MKLRDVRNLSKIKKLLKIFGAESELHLVGGAVRDMLLNVEPKDLDFAIKLIKDHQDQ